MKNEPAIMLRTLRELEALVKSAPFKALAKDRHAKMYVAFLRKAPKPCPTCPLLHEKEALEVIAIAGRDALVVSRPKRSGFYGFPNNFIEDELGVAATTRSWSTVTKVVEFAARET
jgi:uncharacterized protein (DUF1697 family)